ncbi:hypothetical protein [Sodalis praecaptivus]|uniref:hypothetical protein n=1 Tax=Sodalis praecaptivus TaxID=1239307 RepID=UPI00280ACAE9|nr:hypothetical protein [Sodalis praecaptivus]
MQTGIPLDLRRGALVYLGLLLQLLLGAPGGQRLIGIYRWMLGGAAQRARFTGAQGAALILQPDNTPFQLQRGFRLP